MLNIIVFFACFFTLHSETHNEVYEQAQKWYQIQQQLVTLYDQHARLNNDKIHSNQEFFNIQQQLGAIYFAQKRYQLGFGTALLPSERAVHNYVRKKTFLTLKTKELIPLYKKYVQEYQKKYANVEFEKNKKLIKQLEALNILHLKLFEQLKQTQKIKYWTEKQKIEEIPSIPNYIKKLPARNTSKSTYQLNWIAPVAGIKESASKTVWAPLEGAIILCPDAGIVTAIGRLEDSIVVFIKQNHFTYVITGINQCCVNKGDKLKQGDPLGFCADKDPCFVELQLWRDDIALDPEPYHKIFQL